MLYHAFSWLGAATPVWLSLCVIAACAALAWQLRAAIRRLDRHAQSIAHMDEWADTVDHTLEKMEGRSWRLQPAAVTPQRAAAQVRRWWER